MSETATALRRNPGIEEAPLQNELMLFDPTTSKFYVLNSTMAFLWKAIDGTSSLEQITAKAAESFDGVSPSELDADFAAAAEELRDLGLVI